MNKSRFPGKSVNKHQRRSTSYRELVSHGSPVVVGSPSEYNESISKLLLELPSLRQQFGSACLEEFHGFNLNDDIQKACNTKHTELTSIVCNLEKNSTAATEVPNKDKGTKLREKSQRLIIRDKNKSDLKNKRKIQFDIDERNGTEKLRKTETEVLKSSSAISDPFKTPVKEEDTRPEIKTEIKSIISTETLQIDTEKVKTKKTEISKTSMGKVTVRVQAPLVPLEFFKEKEDYVAAVMIFVDGRLNQDYLSFIQEKGWIQCGVCQDISESSTLGQQRKYGAFLCLKCIEFLVKMIKIAKKAESYDCKLKGVCEIISNGEYCKACFVRSCLLLLDLTDDIYFKMWRAVPPNAKNYVPTKPPVVKRYTNRGKVLFVDHTNGTITKICQFKNKPATGIRNVKSEDPNNSKGIKRLFPNDDASKSKVKGARVKQVSRRAGEPERLPRATFRDLQEIHQESASGEKSTEETLLDRLEDKTIKVMCPVNDYEPEEDGYAVVVSEGDEPPKPLCFVCGSAGIKQLIFCSVCCEPYHPYCSEDEYLLSAFIAEVAKENCEAIDLQSQQSCSNFASLCKLCTKSGLGKFQKWKCYRCTTCKSCNIGISTKHVKTKDNCFVKCSSCLDSYHYSCTKKTLSNSLSKSSESVKWMCPNCLKCTSCGIQLNKSHQSNYRKLSTDGNGNNQEREMLCLECFKRRQNGSYCPICLVCYDDNDWDSKMMECDRCARWIHAKCEGLNDEKYYILSSLPETIAYVCRLCISSENEVGWRQAVKVELFDGCTKVLGFFQKKAVGMSRKKRALTFDEDDNTCQSKTQYFDPVLKDKELIVKSEENIELISNLKNPESSFSNQQYPKMNDLSQQPTCFIITVPESKMKEDKDNNISEDELILNYKTKNGIKECYIKLVDLDVTNRKRNQSNNSQKSSRPQSLNSGFDKETKISDLIPIQKTEMGLLTPQKTTDSCFESHASSCSKILSFDFLTPTKLSTPTRVVISFTDAARKANNWSSVEEFYSICLKLIPSIFMELDSINTDRFVEYFKDAMKQVFPWFDMEDKIKIIPEINAPLPSIEIKKEEDSLSKINDSVNQKDNNNALMENHLLPDSIAFEDVFWENDKFMDFRACSFCNEIGDFPIHTCGRLLYAGPGDWLHVNCAIWSSEVWEEDNGALQQIEAALTRSKRTVCNYCENTGASLNCCAGTCRSCFHFLCAIDAGCSLMDNKTVFCPNHEASAKGQVQKDMHVTRKVFVELNNSSRKKDVKMFSSNIKIFIGSMQIESLGRIVPISVIDDESTLDLLVPIGYTAGRLFWSLKPSDKLQFYSMNTILNREGDFRDSFKNITSTNQSFNLIVDHCKRSQDIVPKLKRLDEFFEWIKSAPIFIDEYRVQWQMPYVPLKNGLSKGRNGYKRELEIKVNRATIEWEMSSSCTEISPQSEYGLGKPCSCYPSEKLHFPLGIFNIHSRDSLFISKPSEIKMKFSELMQKIGLLHPAVKYLVEQLHGVETIVGKHKFRYHYPDISPEDTPVDFSTTGSARTDCFKNRKPYDRFGWLASRHRQAPTSMLMSEETVKSKGLPLAMRFRNLKERASKYLVVLPSHIHGRGLFARRDIEIGEMLIEYAGEVIRSSLCDIRERKYENEGMGCYMFRINREIVVDATMKGNAARFINHSCDPNCESKTVKILGKDHILIFALKNIGRGEELTYDYKFEREADKLPCSCNSKKCRKFLN